jgi:hypothetical protein
MTHQHHCQLLRVGDDIEQRGSVMRKNVYNCPL